MPNAIGIIELSSIAAGYKAQDAMLKAAAVELLIARTICSGKFLIVIGGTVSSVNAAIDAGVVTGSGYLIEHLSIPNVDHQVFQALSGSVIMDPNQGMAIGVVETFSATPIIEAADSAVKAADVTLLRVHVSMAIGGKGYFVINGDVSAVKAAVDAASLLIKKTGTLVNRVVIPSASREIYREYC